MSVLWGNYITIHEVYLLDCYPVEDDDHCESPIEAYRHLSHVLNAMASLLFNKSPESLQLYDPYYCQGSVVERLQLCGFPHVYNRKEDFYAVQQENRVPSYDVLVTNPPYSQDHIEKLLRFCVDSKKPFCLLIPNYVYMKDYYHTLLSPYGFKPGTHSSSAMFYVAPTKRYLYTTPYVRRSSLCACLWGWEWNRVGGSRRAANTPLPSQRFGSAALVPSSTSALVLA